MRGYASEKIKQTNIRFARNLPDRLMGLLGTAAYAGILALVPCHDIHTFGMRYPIDVAFADECGIVLSVDRDVQPGHRRRCQGAVIALERQAQVSPWFEVGDVLVLEAKSKPDCRYQNMTGTSRVI